MRDRQPDRRGRLAALDGGGDGHRLERAGAAQIVAAAGLFARAAGRGRNDVADRAVRFDSRQRDRRPVTMPFVRAREQRHAGQKEREQEANHSQCLDVTIAAAVPASLPCATSSQPLSGFGTQPHRVVRNAPLPDRLRHRRGGGNGDRHRFGMGQPIDNRAFCRAGVLFGYLLTMRPLLGSGLPLRRAAVLALASDTASIAIMEIVDNGIMLAIPGAMDAGLGSTLFWGSLALSLAIAALAAFPVNRWLIARGRGHAVVHQHHRVTEARAHCCH